MDDDAYLPFHTRPISALSRQAELSATTGDAEALRNGIDRVIGGVDNGWWAGPTECATYTFASPVNLHQVRMTFDSNQADPKRMPCWYPQEGTTVKMPAMLPRAFAIEMQRPDGGWQRVQTVENNILRLVRLSITGEAKAVRFVPLEAWGGDQVHVMGFEVA